jgi:hypothetical protein
MIALLATTDFDEGKTEKGGKLLFPLVQYKVHKVVVFFHFKNRSAATS